MNAALIHKKLLDWYKANKRDLPWRQSLDPYRIWISEIMLQQTRVEAVLPFYERFLKNFPTTKALAQASEDKVLSLWSGLGYYSRARNIHKAAKSIQADFNGKFPQHPEQLRSLSGIGEYTANAIASIAFQKNVPAIDGNLERVLSRLIDLRENPKKEGRQEIQAIADKIVEHGHAGDINQAIMDLSSLVCLPKNPRCQLCPLQTECKSFKIGSTDLVPLRAKAAPAQELKSQAFLVLHKNSRGQASLLLARRKKKDWLQDLWDIPWQVAPLPQDWQAAPNWKRFGTHKLTRAITKYKVEFEVFFYEAPERKLPPKALQSQAGSEWQWRAITDLDQINLPRPSRRALESALAKLK